MSTLYGICIETANKICAPGDTRISGNQILIGGFVFIGVVGLLWLAWRSR